MLYPILCTVGLLPLTVRRALGYSAGYLFSFIPTRERQIALAHLAAFTGTDPVKTVRKMYASLGVLFFELLNLNPLLSKIDSLKLLNPSLIEKFRERKNPIIALTGHLGNWELLGAFFAKAGFTIHTIGRESRLSAGQDILARYRARYGVITLWRGEKHITKKLLKILKDNGVIAALIDQDTEVASVDIPFLGVSAKTPVALVELGLKTEAIFISTFITRDAAGTYTIHVRRIDSLGKSSADILREYTKHLEELLLLYPEQWVWFHKRWRTREDGVRLRTEEYLRHIQSPQFKLSV